MSLGAWMREFVFYPIMLSKPVTAVSKHFRKRYSAYAGKLVPSVAAPLVVFFLIGIWHGLTWQYIVNGLYNAIVISSSVALAPVYAKLAEKLHVNTENFSFKLFQIARTFIVLCISRTIVKAPSISAAGHMLYKMFTDVDFAFITGVSGELFQYGIDEKEMFMVFIFLLVLLTVGLLQENGVKLRETIAKQNIFFRWAIYLLALAAILIFGTYGPSYDATTFIYGNF
jgi:D-alanyl-lipoteichoic acid acyltransferase DltB (MBOAT superfamily)